MVGGLEAPGAAGIGSNIDATCDDMCNVSNPGHTTPHHTRLKYFMLVSA